MFLKTDTRLSPPQERIVSVAIDAAVTVHRELGAVRTGTSSMGKERVASCLRVFVAVV